MYDFLKRLIPSKIRKNIRKLFTGNRDNSFMFELRTSTEFQHIGPPGAVTDQLFAKVADVPGWFNLDDCGHFLIILRLQAHYATKGNLFEIGSYHGRSTAIMATELRDGEKLVVCDAFAQDTDDPYVAKPSPQALISNIHKLTPELAEDRIEIHECLSTHLALEESRQFRFIHIDGGHSADQAYSDLVYCGERLMDLGVMVMDDYGHPQWPGVREGTDRFLFENPKFETLIDINRHGAQGRKLYIAFRQS